MTGGIVIRRKDTAWYIGVENEVVMPIKIASDDYKAKVRAWVRSPPVFIPAQAQNLPHFSCKRFQTYEEMNAWKREYRKQIARAGGVQWKI